MAQAIDQWYKVDKRLAPLTVLVVFKEIIHVTYPSHAPRHGPVVD